jgi:peptidoglycan/xylan/chitin deacetylase (PgdA/CDA1 family)
MTITSAEAASCCCLTIDVEWAHPRVLADVVELLDERGVRATFFCTHADIDVGAHERALHPNYRVHGDTVRRIEAETSGAWRDWDEPGLFRRVLEITRQFAPEAIGARSHSLFYDSALMPLYGELGLAYDSSCMLPLQPGIRPAWKEYGILELPIFFMDHVELIAPRTGFLLDRFDLDSPGLRVFDFHPNLVYINAASEDEYLRSKARYRDPEALTAMRHGGPGARRLLEDLLDLLAEERFPTATLGELNRVVRDGQRSL